MLGAKPVDLVRVRLGLGLGLGVGVGLGLGLGLERVEPRLAAAHRLEPEQHALPARLVVRRLVTVRVRVRVRVRV